MATVKHLVKDGKLTKAGEARLKKLEAPCTAGCGTITTSGGKCHACGCQDKGPGGCEVADCVKYENEGAGHEGEHIFAGQE